MLAPDRCIICGKYDEIFCSECSLLLIVMSPECPVCRESSSDFLVHKKCEDKINLDSLVVHCEYNDVAQKVVELLKFRFDKRFANIIAEKISTNIYFQQFISPNTIFVPVPLFKKRLKWRGFNQAEEIALSLQKIVEREVPIKNILIRVKETQQQAKLNKAQRMKNVESAFEINSEFLELNKIKKDANIILIDDVTTTCSTLDECAKILESYGFKNVSGVVFARGK